VRGGLATSVVMHVVVLAWAMFTIQTQREIRMPEPEPIAVDLVTQSDVTKLRQGVRTAKQLEAQAKETPKADLAKKEAPRPTPVAAAPPPPEAAPPAPKEEIKPEPPKEPEKVASVPPPPAAAPPPAALPPVVAPDAQKQLEDMLKEQEQQRQKEEERKAEQKKIDDQKRVEDERKQAELKKKQEEEQKRKQAELKKKRDEEKKRKEAEAKKKEFDANKIAALINKTPDKGAPLPASEPTEPTKHKGPTLGAPEGRDRQLSASEMAILGQIIRACVQPKWTILGGGEQAQQTEVKMRLRFHPDGRLAAPPQVTNMQSSPYFLAVSDSAVRAVQACEPFSLPSDKYDFWKDMILTFRPTDMF
jgi:colicin import membrane protein